MTATLRFTRAAFGAVQRASPRLAALWAERIFCTPPRRPISERMASWLREAQRFTVTVGERRVAAWSWGERGAGVLLVHGWGSRGARFVDLGNALLTQGYRVVTFDAPGHGASAGRRSSGLEFARAAQAVVNAVGSVSYIVGHSVGGFASALAIERGLAIRRAVFLAPSANVNSYSAQFETLLGVEGPVMASMRGRLERRLGFSWKDLNIIRPRHACAAARDPRSRRSRSGLERWRRHRAIMARRRAHDDDRFGASSDRERCSRDPSGCNVSRSRLSLNAMPVAVRAL